MLVQFVIPGLPISKGSFRAIARAKRAVLIPSNPRTAAWEATIRLAASRAYRGRPLAPPRVVRVSIAAYFLRPKSVSSAKRPHHCVKPDADKLIRAVLDSLTGVLYVDDCQVDAVMLQKAYADAPCLKVAVCDDAERMSFNSLMAAAL